MYPDQLGVGDKGSNIEFAGLFEHIVISQDTIISNVLVLSNFCNKTFL